MWFMGAKENKVSLICFIPLNYANLLQTNMSLGTAWICWGREYPLVMLGESFTALKQRGGGPRVVVSTAAFHARVRGSVPGLGGLKETKIVSSPSTCES